jgi:hypothetical protein
MSPCALGKSAAEQLYPFITEFTIDRNNLYQYERENKGKKTKL